MPVVAAVSVWPTCAVPVMVGAPVGAVLVEAVVVSSLSEACLLALTTRAHDFLTANDGADFLRAARALALHFPPVQAKHKWVSRCAGRSRESAVLSRAA